MKHTQGAKKTHGYVAVGAGLSFFFALFSYYLWTFEYKPKADPSPVDAPQPPVANRLVIAYAPPAGVWPSLTGRIESPSVAPGGPIRASLTIKNASDQAAPIPFIISKNSHKLFTAVAVDADADAKPFPRASAPTDSKSGFDPSTDEILHLGPQSAYSVDVDLSACLSLTSPGRYRIAVVYDPIPLLLESKTPPSSPVWNRPLRSDAIGTVTVVAPPLPDRSRE